MWVIESFTGGIRYAMAGDRRQRLRHEVRRAIKPLIAAMGA
jgi:hypothetical protein